MPTMEELNARLRQLEEKEVRRNKVNAMLDDLRAQRAERQDKVRETAAVLKKEQADVDKLEGHSLKGLLLSLAGKKEERLDQERREAVAARFQHDQAVRDLEWLDQEILRLAAERDSLKDIPRQLERTRVEKAALLMARGGETGRRLEELERQIDVLYAQQKEINEALNAGREAQFALEQVLGELEDARNMGTWDMLGGGILATMAKHDHINAAQDGLNRVQYALYRFRAELADVELYDCPPVEIGGFATFADYFFDGLIADWVVQSKIRNAQDNVDQAYRQVQYAISRLMSMRDRAAAQIAQLERERDELVARG